MTKPLNFENPPIIEVVCGIQFDNSRFDFKTENDFYDLIKDKFPEIQINQPLMYMFDKLSPSSAKEYEGRFPFLRRYFFINQSKNKLIQLQDGRYLFNWRKLQETEVEYPRFKNVYREFKSHWTILESVFEKQNIKYGINQLELTYIDHIYLEQFELTNLKIDDIFNFFNNTGELLNLDSINIVLSIPQHHLKGHLNIKVNSATSNISKKELLVLDMTLRGMLSNQNMSIDQWFENAHSTILNTFDDIISNKAKSIWRIVYE